MIFRRLLALVGALSLAACSEPARQDRPEPSPALWEVTAPDGAKAWLFGTIHALPDGIEWHTPRLDEALGEAGVLVVEVADLADPEAGPRAFAALASSPGLPPLLRRVPAGERAALAAALDRADLAEADFATTESWAAALLIANAGRTGESANGVDRALLMHGLPVIALEGFAGQFAIFDRLAAEDQATLLYEAAREGAADEEAELTRAWLTGDLARIEREDHDGILADPDLRQALLTGRNRAWTERIAALIAEGRRPLVAVGAAHMAGDEGVPALLAARGFTVRRVQ